MKKSRFFNRKLVMILVLMMTLVMITSAVSALFIVIDGDREPEWLGGGAQTPGFASDPADGAIADDVDISGVRWTNDPTNMYFAIETHGTPRLSFAPFLTQIYICLDTDNNVATGSAYSNCNGLAGFDRYIYILGTASVDVQNSAFASIGSGTLGYNAGAAIPVIEVSVPLASLGFGPGSCPPIVNAVIYYDNGSGDPDDTTPGSGTINTNCGGPTAVSLQNVSANSADTVPAIGIIAFALLAIIGTGVALTRRQQA